MTLPSPREGPPAVATAECPRVLGRGEGLFKLSYQKEKKDHLKEEQPVKVPKVGWLPKNEYLKKLAGDRKASDSNRPRSRSRVKSEKRSHKRSRPAVRKQPQKKKRR